MSTNLYTFNLFIDENAVVIYSAPLMGRKAIPEAEQKQPVSCRVSPPVKRILDAIAQEEHRNVSQVVEILLHESPRVKARLNGKGKHRAK